MLFKKSISPLIATILLIAITVIIITILLKFTINFTSSSLPDFLNAEDYTQTNKDIFTTLDSTASSNGKYYFKYTPLQSTNSNFTINYFKINNFDMVPLDVPKEVSPGNFILDLGIIYNNSFNLTLFLDDGTYFVLKDVSSTILEPTSNDCPTGFIPVPGSSFYNTDYGSKKGFCVAKYEMKMDMNGDGIGETVSDYPEMTQNVKTWYFDENSEGTIVSSAKGSPIGNITVPEAIASCEDINGHLITNEEWMTIIRNIELVEENWLSEQIGSGHIYKGHSDANPFYALEASTDDDFYFGTGNSALSGTNQKRTYILSNEEIIWDLSGNVDEWVDHDFPIMNADNRPYTYNKETEEIEYFFEGTFSFSTPLDGYNYLRWNNLGTHSALKYSDMYLLTSGNYNYIDNGVGTIYFTPYSGRGLRRGGNYQLSYRVGIMHMSFHTSMNHIYGNLGFRCVVIP